MKKMLDCIMAFCIAITLSSCTSTQVAIKGNYPIVNSATTSTSYDQVWSNVIDFFAEHSIPIGTIAKDSGLITAPNVSLGEELVSYEDKSGQIVDPNTWFVLPYNKNVVGCRAECSFNVRVKQMENGDTNIQINLSNIVGYYNIEYLDTFSFKKEIIREKYPRDCYSTGKFEQMLLSLFK